MVVLFHWHIGHGCCLVGVLTQRQLSSSYTVLDILNMRQAKISIGMLEHIGW